MTVYTVEQLQYIHGFLNKCYIHFDSFDDLDGLLVFRDTFLDDTKYNIIINNPDFYKLKDILHSSSNTSLHQTAKIKQKFPLLNLVRQILRSIHFKMTPIRKSDGYDNNGKKLFKRYFLIEKMKCIEPIPIISINSHI